MSSAASTQQCRKELLQQHLFQGKKIILFLSGKDALIEKLWQEKEELKFFEQLSRMGFVAITAVNFSVFFGECAVGQQYNLKKSLKSFEILQSLGTRAIPHVYWQNTSQLLRWVEWLKNNPVIKTISINCQRYRKNDYPLVEAGLKYILNSVNRNLRIILEGPPRAFLNNLSDCAENIHIAMEEPAYDAIFHKQKLVQGERLFTIHTDKEKARLVQDNISSYGEYLSKNFYKR